MGPSWLTSIKSGCGMVIGFLVLPYVIKLMCCVIVVPLNPDT